MSVQQKQRCDPEGEMDVRNRRGLKGRCWQELAAFATSAQHIDLRHEYASPLSHNINCHFVYGEHFAVVITIYLLERNIQFKLIWIDKLTR